MTWALLMGRTDERNRWFELCVVAPLAAAPARVNMNIGRRARCRYIPGGIAQEALFIQLFNIVLPNFFALLNPPAPLFSLVLSHHARTQDAADTLMDPPPFLLPLRVANTVRTVALTVLYMPVLPASTLLGLAGAIVSCAPL